jgi:excisionase family DNA binding protein
LTTVGTEPPRCLRVEEAAHLLQVGRTTAYDLIRSGRLRSFKVGRRRLVPRDAVEAMISESAGEED